VYGDSDPALTFTVSGWQGNDKNDSASIITGALSREAGEDAGAYEITLGTLSAASYAVELTSGVEFEITPSPQSIDFSPAASWPVEDGDYALTAAAVTPGSAPALRVRFRISAADSGRAELLADSILHPKQSGTVTVTAYVEPDPNYEAAPEVSRLIALTSSSVGVREVTVSGATGANGRYVVDDPATQSVTIRVIPHDNGAAVSYNGAAVSEITVDVRRGGTQAIAYTVTSQDGAQKSLDTLTVEQRLSFQAYISLKWDIVLILHLRRLDDEEYHPSQCRWYRNGSEFVGTGFFYSNGESRDRCFVAGDAYHAELETPSGTVRTTSYTIPATAAAAPSAALHVYPNPARVGEPIYLSLGGGGGASPAAANSHAGASIYVYDVGGTPALQKPAAGNLTELRLAKPGMYIIVVNGQATKVVVK
jgi:hypothetical protein